VRVVGGLWFRVWGWGLRSSPTSPLSLCALLRSIHVTALSGIIDGFFRMVVLDPTAQTFGCYTDGFLGQFSTCGGTAADVCNLTNTTVVGCMSSAHPATPCACLGQPSDLLTTSPWIPYCSGLVLKLQSSMCGAVLEQPF
jgi:hypothetical protein